MEFTIGNFRGPSLAIEVTNAGYRIDGLQVPSDIAWLFDVAILKPEVSDIFESLIDAYVTGMGHACSTSSLDVLNVTEYVHEHWELEPC